MIQLIDLLEDVFGKRKRIPKDRIVYVYTFPEQTDEDGNRVKYAYVGITDKEGRRATEHKRTTGRKPSPVAKYAESIGIDPKSVSDYKKIVSLDKEGKPGYVDEGEAVKLEREYMAKYKADGWKLLNTAPGGSLGGGYIDEDRVIEGIDQFLKDPTSTNIEDLGLLSSQCKYAAKIITDLGLKDKVFNKLKGIIDSNNIKSNAELKIPYRGFHNIISDMGWSDALFGTAKFTHGSQQKGVEGFIAEPDNLNKDQLKLLTKRAAIGITPEQEKALLTKLKKIIDKYNVKSQGELNKLDPARKNAFDVMFSLQAGDAIEKGKEDWKDILWPEGYPGRGTGMKRKASITESVDDKEVLRRTIQGFELIPVKYGFGHPYVTKNGKATSDLATRINTWIQGEFNGSSVKVKYDPTYKALNFFKS